MILKILAEITTQPYRAWGRWTDLQLPKMLLYSSNVDKIEVKVLKISEFVMYISQRLIAHEGKEKHMLKRVKLDNKFRASTTSILKKFSF